MQPHTQGSEEHQQRHKQMIASIQDTGKESRREWMPEVFLKAGEANSRNKTYQFGRQDNQSKELYGAAFIAQKIDYIHNNTVVTGLVRKP